MPYPTIVAKEDLYLETKVWADPFLKKGDKANISFWKGFGVPRGRIYPGVSYRVENQSISFVCPGEALINSVEFL